MKTRKFANLRASGCSGTLTLDLINKSTSATGWQDDLEKNCPIIFKVAKTAQIMPKYKPCFETAYMSEIVINLQLKVSPFLGYFFVSKNHNEPNCWKNCPIWSPYSATIRTTKERKWIWNPQFLLIYGFHIGHTSFSL